MPAATATKAAESRSSSAAGPEAAATASAAAAAALPAAPSLQPGHPQNEALRQVLNVIDKKVRNMEKKKAKLDDYQERLDRGEALNQDQLEAVGKLQEVANNLEFARELQRSFIALGQDIQKSLKKAARREQLMREEVEQKRLKTVLELQYVLDKLGDDDTRNDLKQGWNGSFVLTEEELTLVDDFYKLVQPERDMNLRLCEQFEQSSVHLWDLLEGRDKAVGGTTYKKLKEIVDRLLCSGYFDSVHNHQNGVCEEEEPSPVPAEEQPPEPEPEAIEEYVEQTDVEAREFVNRQFIAEAQFSSSQKEQADEWNAEPVEVVNSLQQQQQQQQPPTVPETHALNTVAPSDPLVRRQRVQDLMAQMQGTFNFMQDSMLEFESQTMDPAIVSAQPMNPAQTMEMPQMVCTPVHSESRHAQSNAVSVPSEVTQVPLVSSTTESYTPSQPMYQPSHVSEQRTQKESMDSIQVTMSLASEQPPTSTAIPVASQSQAFQAPPSKPLHSSGINVNAAPFQSMQTVFNMNAPVPPASEPEALKQQSPYQASYTQGFSSQPQHQVEQSELQQETLTTVSPYHTSQDQTHPAAGAHQQLSQQIQQNAGFQRTGQAFYNSRGVSRGGPRNSRGAINGYRGPTNGFRGGYDSYRPPFSNTPNSGYGQSPFTSARDYSNSSYQRDGYQPNFKRGSGPGGPRGTPRELPRSLSL
uniref:Cell cycle associated protein 1b n=1 Tax=Callorhinchus milii TaxID=7868 RepID=A0A4W3K1H6_CALMI|eukprot:gi/632941345/ref/XP_007885816.1/ PREDICTED: caprin-1 isoform X2 [Callorhinchus milii]